MGTFDVQRTVDVGYGHLRPVLYPRSNRRSITTAQCLCGGNRHKRCLYSGALPSELLGKTKVGFEPTTSGSGRSIRLLRHSTIFRLAPFLRPVGRQQLLRSTHQFCSMPLYQRRCGKPPHLSCTLVYLITDCQQEFGIAHRSIR